MHPWGAGLAPGRGVGLTGPVSVEGAVVVGVDWTWGVAVDVAVDWVVSVAGAVDAFTGREWVVVDGLAPWPAGGQLGDVAQGAEHAAWATVDRIGGPYVIRSYNQKYHFYYFFSKLNYNLIY